MLAGYNERALAAKNLGPNRFYHPSQIKSAAEAQKLMAAMDTYAAGGEFVWPSEQLKNAPFAHYATAAEQPAFYSRLTRTVE